MAAFSRFSEEVLEEELNALIQKAISQKTKIARKYGVRNLKGKEKTNLRNQFDSFTRRIVAGVSSALVVWIDSIIVYQKKYCCSFVSSSKISTKTIRILALNFHGQLIEISSSYSNC